MSLEVSTIDWLAATAQSAKELVETTLGFKDFKVLPKVIIDEEIQCGSYIEIIAGQDKITIGMLTNRVGSQKITEGLLGMEPMSEEDEADSLKEIINILAGRTKIKMQKKVKGLQIGKPFFFKGNIHFRGKVESMSNSELWGGNPVTLIVIQQKEK
ncbi:hypothetical protein KAR34_03120 [bacterium]|nr:hypothetical protein [bacterium]